MAIALRSCSPSAVCAAPDGTLGWNDAVAKQAGESALVHPVSAWSVKAAGLRFRDEFSEQDRQAA